MQRRSIPLPTRLTSVKPAAAPAEVARPAPPTIPPALNELLASLTRTIAEVHGRRDAAQRAIESLSIELGVALAEHLLKREIAADRQRLDRIVAHALARVSARRSVTLRAHPDDIALLERQLAESADLAPNRELLTLQRDDTLVRGQLRCDADDCLVEWDTARALAELHALLLEDALAHRGAEGGNA